MTGHELRRLDQVRLADQFLAETNVRYRDRTRLLGIIDKIALGVVVRVLADNLYRVFVRTNGTVGAESVEETSEILALDLEREIRIERSHGDVVLDPDREMILRILKLQVIENSLGHRRIEFFGAESVTSADNEGVRLEVGDSAIQRLVN